LRKRAPGAVSFLSRPVSRRVTVSRRVAVSTDV
jgi:ribosomal protein L31E